MMPIMTNGLSWLPPHLVGYGRRDEQRHGTRRVRPRSRNLEQAGPRARPVNQGFDMLGLISELTELGISEPERTEAMRDLLQLAVHAHGGMTRWRQLTEISAHVSISGALWGSKGHPDVLADTHVTLDPHRQRISYDPFITADQRSIVTPDYTAIETHDGRVIADRANPRAAFAGHTPTTPWDELHVAYFSGYAMWNYLTLPFLLTHPGMQLQELEAHQEDGQAWRRLEATFPDSLATHNRIQTFYFDHDGLLRRHDYNADVFGGTPAANYSSGHKTFGGIVFPTQRRVVPLRPDGSTLPEPILVAIDLYDAALH